MVTPEEDEEVIRNALVTLVGRARRKAIDASESDNTTLQIALFYTNIHDIMKDLLDLVDFEITQNWDDGNETTG